MRLDACKVQFCVLVACIDRDATSQRLQKQKSGLEPINEIAAFTIGETELLHMEIKLPEVSYIRTPSMAPLVLLPYLL